MRTLILSVLALLTLAACASTTPAQTVFKIEAGYVALVQAAGEYATLPRCTTDGPKVCSDQGAVDQMRKAVKAADAAIDAAESTVRSNPNVDASFAIAAAQNAVQAVSVLLATYHVGGL